MVIKTEFWNSGIVFVGEGELVGDAEKDGDGVGVDVFDGAVGVGEETAVGCAKLWKASVAGLAVPSWLKSPSSKVKRKLPLLS